MNDFLFKDRHGQTPLPREMEGSLKIRTIQTMRDLDEHEEDNIVRGLNWLAKQTFDPGRYDFWLKLHEKLFEDVWSWAGKIRTHELANPDFCRPFEIWPELYRLEKDLAFWTKEHSFEFSEIAARFHERIESIHPFANGNGRFGRILTEQICRFHKEAVPKWGRTLKGDTTKRRQQYIEAIVIASREGKYELLQEFMYS